MREALAAADHDFVLREPASKLQRLREKLLTSRGSVLCRTARQGRRYLRVLATGLFSTMAAAILVNALAWQKTRHPAPLFSHAAPATPVKEPTIAEAIAVPASRPQPAVTAIPAQDKPSEKPAAPKSPADKPPQGNLASGNLRQSRAEASPPRDQISELLKAPHASPARPNKAAAAPAMSSKPVLAAQHALVKLGFVLKPDGVAGTATRQAIERYERDHGLPVRGALTPALMRHLSKETGISIN